MNEMPPAEIVEAAFKVGQWFTERNIAWWKLGPCQSRSEDPFPADGPASTFYSIAALIRAGDSVERAMEKHGLRLAK